MQARHIWRILALVAVALATCGLVVGACASHKPAPSTSKSGGGQNVGTRSGQTRGSGADPVNQPETPAVGDEESRPDGGAETLQRRPTPSRRPGRVQPKGHKGMLGQMRLQDGED